MSATQSRGTLAITGGARGIGAAVARQAAAAGYALAIGYRHDRAAAAALLTELRATGATAEAFAADVADAAAVQELFRAIDRALPPLAGLVTSAGIAGPDGPVERYDGAGLGALFATNVVGTILSCREAVTRLSRARGGPGGAIVNVSSMAATIGGRPGRAAYAASKAAVDVFTVGLAKEVATQGIRVNAVRPGMTRTDMTAGALDDPRRAAALVATIPLQRIASADEVAAPILWLLSEQASFGTGALLDVSGGGFVVGAASPSPAASTAGAR